MHIVPHTPAVAGRHPLSSKRPSPNTPNTPDAAPDPAPEPLTDDPPDATPACGWFGSSLELRQGLEVVELRESGPRRHPIVGRAAVGPRWPPGTPALP